MSASIRFRSSGSWHNWSIFGNNVVFWLSLETGGRSRWVRSEVSRWWLRDSVFLVAEICDLLLAWPSIGSSILEVCCFYNSFKILHFHLVGEGWCELDGHLSICLSRSYVMVSIRVESQAAKTLFILSSSTSLIILLSFFFYIFLTCYYVFSCLSSSVSMCGQGAVYCQIVNYDPLLWYRDQ